MTGFLSVSWPFPSQKHFIIFSEFLHIFVQKVRPTYRYKSDLPKKFDFYDMEGLFISIVFYFKPYLSVNYFNNYRLSQFDGSSFDLMYHCFAVTYLVRHYCVINTQCPCNCACVSTLLKNKKAKPRFKYSTSISILCMKENKKQNCDGRTE